MATPTDLSFPATNPLGAVHRLASGAPLLAVALVWLTTAGHTLNFREMNAAKGWVAAEAYSLHSAYLLALGLTMLACWHLAERVRARLMTLSGLALFVLGSAVNGLLLHGSLGLFVVGRVLAGVGGGMVLFAAPGLLDPRWENTFTWAAILLPPLGPAVVSGASLAYGWSSWEGGFLFQGLFALVCLVGMAALPRPEPRLPPPVPHAPAWYFPWLVLSVVGFWYCMHWGQLEGWLESSRVVIALTAAVLSLVWCGWLLWPAADRRTLREDRLRLLLMAFGGAVQFFHGTTMTIYSSLFVNYNVWQRFWLVWSMPIGVALALCLAAWWQRRMRLGLAGAAVGLLVLAGGMVLLNRVTMGWPFWLVQNPLELNWFQAPLHWQVAPGRIVTGLGLGLLMASATALASRRVEAEVRVRQLLPVVQTVAGGFSIGLLVTWLLIGHQTEYSYVAETVGSIQAQELAARMAQFRQALVQSGVPPGAADRQVVSLFYRSVNYQADNLTYAQMYAGFFVASLVLAALVALKMVRSRLWEVPRTVPGVD